MEIVILICSHGRLGEELVKSAQLIGGTIKDVHCFSLNEGQEPDDYYRIIETFLEENNGKEILCMVDLFGGTPCITITRLLKKYKMQVVTGVNLPMLLEVTSFRDSTSIDDLAVIAKETLENSCINVTEKFKEMKDNGNN